MSDNPYDFIEPSTESEDAPQVNEHEFTEGDKEAFRDLFDLDDAEVVQEDQRAPLSAFWQRIKTWLKT